MSPIQSSSHSEYDMILPVIFGGVAIVTLALSVLLKKAPEDKKKEESLTKRVTFLQTTTVIVDTSKKVKTIDYEEIPDLIPINGSLIETKEVIEEIIEKILLNSIPEKEDDEWVSVDKNLNPS